MRRRRSTTCSSGTLILKGRMVLSSAAKAKRAGKTFKTPATAEMARISRRVDDVVDMALSSPWYAVSSVQVSLSRKGVNHGRAVRRLVSGYQRLTCGNEKPRLP